MEPVFIPRPNGASIYTRLGTPKTRGAEAVLLNDRLRRQTTQMNVNDGKSRRKKRRGSVVGGDGKSLRRRKSRASQRKIKKKKWLNIDFIE